MMTTRRIRKESTGRGITISSTMNFGTRRRTTQRLPKRKLNTMKTTPRTTMPRLALRPGSGGGARPATAGREGLCRLIREGTCQQSSSDWQTSKSIQHLGQYSIWVNTASGSVERGEPAP